MAHCIMLGFNSGDPETIEKWARLNLVSKSSSIPHKESGTYSDWIKANFVTASSTVPTPTSQTKSALVEWASNNFIMLR